MTASGSSPSGALELVRFLGPFLRPVRGEALAALVLGFLSVLAGAGVPLLVESALEPSGGLMQVALLGLLMALEIILFWSTARLAYIVATRAAEGLTLYVYAHTLERPVIRQVGLRRPSVISRHTSDVDRIEEAVDATISEGLPGVTRILLSLMLLVYVEPRAGVILAVGTVVFLAVYLTIGRSLLRVDRDRLNASSDVGALVDESITAERAIRGLGLTSWMRGRLAERADRLRLSTMLQKKQASRLVIAARTVGYLALFAVIAEGVVAGATEAGAIAAALLYIDAIVRGLEALPPWLRGLRLATTSKRRIEQITASDPIVTRESSGAGGSAGRGLSLHDLALEPDSPLTVGSRQLPAGGYVAVVADAGQSISRLMEVMAGEADPDGGTVTLDGIDVRHPQTRRRIGLVASDSHLMDASTMDHLRACDPFLTVEQARTVLDQVGLAHLHELPDGGLARRLGTHGSLLSVHERQRLLLAMAICSSVDVLMVESTPLLADVDSAAHLMLALSRAGERQVIIAARSADLAVHCDHVLVLTGTEVLSGRHAELMSDERYRGIWERESAGSVDQRMLDAIPESQRAAVRSRITTEQFPAGETLFRAGAPADQLLYIITGRVVVLATGEDGIERRVAQVGPGNFCGAVESLGSIHTTTVRAERDTLVRTLSVETWSAGLNGLLDGTPAQRRALRDVLRSPGITEDDLLSTVVDVDDRDAVREALAELVAAGEIHRQGDGGLSLTARRRTVSGAASVLDSMRRG